MYAYIMSHRTQIILSDDLYARVMREAKRTGLGLGELTRRALAKTYGRGDERYAKSVLDRTFGAWGEGEDGESFVESMRPGMAHRLAR
jgi:Arc/MetJ family transcription regulator